VSTDVATEAGGPGPTHRRVLPAGQFALTCSAVECGGKLHHRPIITQLKRPSPDDLRSGAPIYSRALPWGAGGCNLRELEIATFMPHKAALVYQALAGHDWANTDDASHLGRAIVQSLGSVYARRFIGRPIYVIDKP